MHMQSCCFANITYHFFAVLVAVAVIIALSSLISCREVGLAIKMERAKTVSVLGPTGSKPQLCSFETNVGQTYDRFGLNWHSNQ